MHLRLAELEGCFPRDGFWFWSFVRLFFVGGKISMIIKFCQIQFIFKLHFDFRKPLTVRVAALTRLSTESKPLGFSWRRHSPSPQPHPGPGTLILKSPEPRNFGFVRKEKLKSYIFLISPCVLIVLGDSSIEPLIICEQHLTAPCELKTPVPSAGLGTPFTRHSTSQKDNFFSPLQIQPF